MKQLFTLALGTVLLSPAYGQQPDSTYVPYRKGEKWGYCTPDKKVVVQPRFEEVHVFYGPLTTAKLDSQYCIINKKGDVLHKSKYYCNAVNGDMHYVTREKYNQEQLFDATGKPLTKVYYKVEGFNQYGYARVTSEYVKMGLMDKSFKEVITPAYGSIEFVNKDLIRVFDNKTYKSALVSVPSGRMVTAWYSKIYDPRDGLIMVIDNGKCGFIDMNGKEVIPLQYTKETPGSEKRNSSFNESTYEDFNYDGFYEGLAVVVKDEKAGYISKQGKVVIPFIYEKAYGFSNGMAWAMQNGKWGMINKSGKTILPFEQQYPNHVYAKELEALDGYHEGFIAVAKDTLWGYADSTGKMVIAPKYTRATPFINGLAGVYTGETMGFIDRTGKYVIPPVFKWVDGTGEWNREPFRDNYGIALLPEEKWVLIDKKGKQLLPYKFNVNDNIYFQDGIAYATADDIVYVFDTKGKVLHTFPKGHYAYAYTRNLLYDYTEKCYINIGNKMKYCDD